MIVFWFLRSTVFAQEKQSGEETTTISVSPDKKWEYRIIGQDTPALFETHGKGPALKLLEQPNSFSAQGKVIWAPDSRRFGYNCRLGSRYESTELYQLRSGKWTKLRAVECEETTAPLNRAKAKQIRRLKLSKDVYQRRIWDTWRLRKWIDADTAILYVQSARSVPLGSDEGTADVGAHFLFTLKLDAQGNWRIVKSYEMTDDEAEKEEAQ